MNHTVIRERDLERHLKNETLKEDMEEKETAAPFEVEEKDDSQLQRAVDTLKAWKVFENILLKKAAKESHR